MTPGAPGEAEPAISTARLDHGQSATATAKAPRHVAKLIVEHPRRDAKRVAELVEVVLSGGEPTNQALPRGFDLGGRFRRAGVSPSLHCLGLRRGDAESPRTAPPERKGERSSTKVVGGEEIRS